MTSDLKKPTAAGALRKVIQKPQVSLGKALRGRLAPAKPVRDAYGEEHEAATLIKALHRSGGQALTKRSPR